MFLDLQNGKCISCGDQGRATFETTAISVKPSLVDDHQTMKQLYKVSHVYQRPLSFFYLDELPKGRCDY